jgi:Ca2+-binding EF-hand superfamily protein
MSVLALLLAVPATAGGVDGLDGIDGGAVAFDRFMRASGPICQQRPAEQCVAFAWRFADTDGDRRLSLAELESVRAAVGSWALRHRGELAPAERSSLALGLLLVDSIGVERLLALYDSNHDGLISRSELLADVRLDRRPLGQVLLDPAALDRAAIARRLGLPPALVERLQP